LRVCGNGPQSGVYMANGSQKWKREVTASPASSDLDGRCSKIEQEGYGTRGQGCRMGAGSRGRDGEGGRD
jgi:hypothetical protein